GLLLSAMDDLHGHRQMDSGRKRDVVVNLDALFVSEEHNGAEWRRADVLLGGAGGWRPSRTKPGRRGGRWKRPCEFPILTGADRGHDRAGRYLSHSHFVAGDCWSAGPVRQVPDL